MLNISKAFSSFSVNDIKKAREFYGKTLGLELSSGPEGTLALLIAWLLVNSGKIPRARAFDLYPFSLLGLIVAVEAVILSSFILMRQNRMMRRGERRDHLNLQVA